MAAQIIHDPLHRSAGNGQANPFHPQPRHFSRVNAYNFTAQVDQGAAAGAGVNYRVGLDKSIGILAVRNADLAPNGTNDTCRNSLLKVAQRVAGGQYTFPDPYCS